MKSGTIQDATFIESDPGKHGKKKPPVPVDPEPPEVTEEKTAETQDKEKATGKDGKKRMTKVEKRELLVQWVLVILDWLTVVVTLLEQR